MRRASHAIRFCLAGTLLAGSLAGGGALRAETVDFSGYFAERKTLDTAAALLNTFTLEEARMAVGVLDEHLGHDPRNAMLSGLKSVLLTVFRADHGVASAGEAAARNETEAQRLESLAQDSLKPSVLTGKPDEITANRYLRQAGELRSAAQEDIAATQVTLRTALRDAVDFSAFCRDRGEGRVAAKLQQLARSKAQRLPRSEAAGAPPAFWSEREMAESLAASDRLHHVLRRGADALLAKRYLEISRSAAEALPTFPGNPWLLALNRAADEALAQAGAQFDACEAARQAKDHETALALAEKCLAIVSDHEGATAAKRDLGPIVARREPRLAEAKILEEAGLHEEAWEIYDLYGRNDDLLRIAAPTAREREERGNFLGANVLYKVAGDVEGIRRTQGLMQEQVDDYREAEALAAAGKRDQARAIYESYRDVQAVRRLEEQ